MLKNVAGTIVSMLLGIIFLFSAYVKIYPIELFEFSFIEINLASWASAPYIARVFISLEFFIGILLLLNINGGNKLLAKLTLGLLIILTFYLILIIIDQGNNGNCGCFGTFIKMTPLESIVKNLILISLTIVLFLTPSKLNISSEKYIILSAAIAAISAPFILNPVSEVHPPSVNDINYELRLDELYQRKMDIPHYDLRKGKRVIAFMSLTCPHCKIGAQKLNIIHNQHPELPIYFILNGEKSELNEFLQETKTKSIKYSFMSAKEGFIVNSGLSLPAILWVNNNKVENKTKYTQLNEKDLMKWFNN
jgi:hypothetical protein